MASNEVRHPRCAADRCHFVWDDSYITEQHEVSGLIFEAECDEQDRQLLGSWVLTTRTQHFQLDLLDDHQLIAHRRPIPFPNPSKHEREWFAKGRWNLHYGRLHMMATSLRLSTSDKFVQAGAPLPRLDHLPIVQIANDAITLNKGVVLKRAHKPVEIPNSASR